MNALRSSARSQSASGVTALYLRLPARTDVPVSSASKSELALQSALQSALPYALAVRGTVKQQGVATLDALSAAVHEAQRVVLLLAASDVTVLRVAVPPLPAHRLRQALPALVEDRLIGDPADCVLAAGPVEDGLRTVAVVDRLWLEQWTARLRRLGARRLSALPLQLCLTMPSDRLPAALLDFPHPLHHSRELVLRLGIAEGAGLPLGDAGSDTASPPEVLRAAAALTAGKALRLSVPEEELERFREALAEQAQTLPDTELRAFAWSDLTEGAAQSEIDLMAGVVSDETSTVDWRRWRLPVALAVVLLLLNLFALNWDWWRLHREGTRLQAEMLRVYRTAFPGDGVNDQLVMADPLGRMKQKRIALRRAAGEASPGDFLSLSAAMGEAWPAIQQATGLDARAVESVEYRDAGLTLHLKSGSQASVEAVRKLLAERQLSLEADSAASSWRVRSMQ